jgi:hypothetical protein
MTALLLVVALAQAPATVEPEVFVDRGETYVRIGFDQGLTKGVTLDIVAADRRAVIGTAVVMEVWDGLARVSLDSTSAAFKGLRLARLRNGVGAQPVAAAMPPPPAPTTSGRVPAVAPPPPPPPTAGRRLNAKVTISAGALDARRVMISNLDSYDWHNCKVVLPDGRDYTMSELAAHQDEGIMMFRFESGAALRDPQGLVAIRCSEGDGRFVAGL